MKFSQNPMAFDPWTASGPTATNVSNSGKAAFTSCIPSVVDYALLLGGAVSSE